MWGNSLGANIEKLQTQIEELEATVRKLMRQKKEVEDEAGYSEQIIQLKKKLADLEIQQAKKQETFDREKREVEHSVGLERRRSEFETEAATRDAVLTVREQNLTNVQENLQKQIDFMVERFTSEVGYLKDEVLKTVIQALPNYNVEVERSLGNGNSNGNSNGHHDKVDADVEA